MSGQGRFAVYFAPRRDSAWWTFGADWLGRDDATAMPRTASALPGFSAAEREAITREPRRYGFHATLKAPMQLAHGSLKQLAARVDRLAAGLPPLPLGALVATPLDGFVALVPTAPAQDLQALAARCVRELDDLRAPLDAAGLARRQPERLDARGRALLADWGYPHVMERFRFHMTLSGPLPAAQAERLIAALQPTLDGLHARQAPVLDRLCIFHEPEPGAPFLRVHDAPLGPA